MAAKTAPTAAKPAPRDAAIPHLAVRACDPHAQKLAAYWVTLCSMSGDAKMLQDARDTRNYFIQWCNRNERPL